jgi:hypothetical protein
MKTKNDTPLASMCPISDWCVGLYHVSHLISVCVCQLLSVLEDTDIYRFKKQ